MTDTFSMSRFTYTQRLPNLIYLSLFTVCFMKIFLHPSEPDEWREIFMKQPVNKFR